MDASVKSAIMQDISKVIFSYTAYPSSQQILSVAEALVAKFPCLKSQKYPYPEIKVNTLKRKHPTDAGPSKNVKKPKKAEVNYLSPHPVGKRQDTLEERLELLDEVKKKNNAKIITDKISKTFSSRRVEVVTLSPSVSVFKETWPALFSEAQVRMFEKCFLPTKKH